MNHDFVIFDEVSALTEEQIRKMMDVLSKQPVPMDIWPHPEYERCVRRILGSPEKELDK